MQRDGDAVGRHVDPLDQQPEDSCLLRRVELVPDGLERTDRASPRRTGQLSRPLQLIDPTGKYTNVRVVKQIDAAID